MSETLFLLSLLAFILGASVTALPGKQAPAKISFTLAALAGLLAALAGLAGIYGEGFQTTFDLGSGLGAAGLRLDRLSALFVLISGVVMLPVSIYSLEYGVQGPRRAFAALYNLLLLATLLIFTADNAFTFLLFWEVAAILFYALVIFEDRRVGRVSAGYVTFVASKLGTALILAAFLTVYAGTGSFAFERMATSPQLPEAWRSAAFILAFVGFGLKAGMAPVQIWLPDAHSKSPKPVSALLAGVLLNLGFYGLVRFNMEKLSPATIRPRPCWSMLGTRHST